MIASNSTCIPVKGECESYQQPTENYRKQRGGGEAEREKEEEGEGWREEEKGRKRERR